MPRTWIVAIVWLALAEVAAPATPESDSALEARLRAVAARSHGALGATAILVGGARRASVAGGARFPMASTYKLPIALTLLSRVDDGTLGLDERMPVLASDLRPGPPGLAQQWRPGQQLAIETLLRAMVVDGDNGACDLLLARLGGTAAVRAHLAALGVVDMEVSRPESGLLFGVFGVASPPPQARWTVEAPQDLVRAVPPAEKRAAAEVFFSKDTRDTTTPDAMARLLERFARGELLKPETTRLLDALMKQTGTAPDRLKGLLPAGVVVAHKPGTCADVDGFNCANDVGLVDLPDGRRAAIAVYLKNADAPPDARARAIAEIGRAVFDAWSPPAR